VCVYVACRRCASLAQDDGTRENWYGDSGVMKRGPFVVADRGVGPLITERNHLVLYVVDTGQSRA